MKTIQLAGFHLKLAAKPLAVTALVRVIAGLLPCKQNW